MSVILRPFQKQLESDIYSSWARGNRNVMAVSATGSGKTVLFSKLLSDDKTPNVAIAHRQELVSQISIALARNEVRHRIIGSQALVRNCVQGHIAELGYSFYDPSAKTAAAGVDTLIRMDASDPWFRSVQFWVQDEGHHVLRENKWGAAASMFPNARGLAVTATPIRGDGKGLGRHADGLMDDLVLAPSMRDLINMGFLTDYRIFAPPSDLDLTNVPVSASGDFSPEPLRNAVHKSHIVGDVVQHYLKIAPNKLGVTFAVDVKSATDIAMAFRAAGVPAEVVSAKTPDGLRASLLRQFARGDIKQLVNVDLFGEGFDLPAIEVVSLARPTMSFSLFAQQFGRALRLMLAPEVLKGWGDKTDEQRLWAIAHSNKPYALVIDHVGNLHRHGLPDAKRTWSLDRREKRSRKIADDVIPTTTCLVCISVYERTFAACPYCGATPLPASRKSPEFVDGVLSELDQETLAKLRGEVDKPLNLPYGASPAIVGSLKKHYHERQLAQTSLRDAISLYGGWQTHLGRGVNEAQKRFYWHFGIDVLSAQALAREDAESLRARIEELLTKESIIAKVSP
jgi:superfamily II DNA or RNA helicase